MQNNLTERWVFRRGGGGSLGIFSNISGVKKMCSFSERFQSKSNCSPVIEWVSLVGGIGMVGAVAGGSYVALILLKLILMGGSLALHILYLVYDDLRSSSRPPFGMPPRIFSRTLFTKSVEPPAMRIPAAKVKKNHIILCQDR